MSEVPRNKADREDRSTKLSTSQNQLSLELLPSTVVFSINSMLMLHQVIPVRGLQKILLPLMSTAFPYRAQFSFVATDPVYVE